MRALTIRQPWADAITVAEIGKDVENRTWPVPAALIGTRILIHAAAAEDRDAIVYGDRPDTRSAIIAVATLAECHMDDGNNVCCSTWAFPGQYHWRLGDVRRLPRPVPAKGRLGLWIPDEELLAAVEQQLPEVAR